VSSKLLPIAARRGTDLLALGLLALVVLPLVALVASGSIADLWKQLRNPVVLDALALSLRTSVVSLIVIVVAGMPLSWRIARSPTRRARWIAAILELPIVIPPAVIGIALLLAFGRNGMFAPWVARTGWSIPFTSTAVVIAQIVVAAPFFVQSAIAAWSRVDDDALLVARTLGASPLRAFLRVAVPAAAPGLLTGIALSWARALGEFGATLLFAGNLEGRTQTMPLAIYAALERDVATARAIAVILGCVALFGLLLIRALPLYRDRGDGSR
jgi:molybdate transport system permease protein